MANSGKDVIYIDADEEITGIIDKLRSSDKQLVALVLPKRASMLQSSVNMKLLKKSADQAKKHVVLVTTESNLLPLAGSVGLYVARNLDSKPEIPTEPGGSELDDLAAADEAAAEEDFIPEEAADKPVGQLANLPEEEPKPSPKKVKPELTPMPIPRASDPDEEETIELDNTDVPEKDLAEAAAVTAATTRDKKSKNKLKVPNFEKFRLRLILAVALLVVLIVGFIIANIVLPKATIAIGTKTSGVAANLTINLSTSATQLDKSSSTVPAYLQQDKKSQSQQVNTTGQKNEGQQASGSVTMTAQVCSPPYSSPSSIPAGTGLSSNGLTFITQSTAQFSPAPGGGFTCVNYQSNSVNITAQNGGTQYNVNNATFNVAGYSGVTATGSTSGGTDQIVQVVSQADIQSAEDKMSGGDTNTEKSSLQTALKQAGYYPLPDTFSAGKPSTSSSAQVGAQATSVTVTQTTTYTMFGVHQSDLAELIKDSVDGQIDTSKQAIVDNGLSSASFSVLSQSSKAAQLNMEDTASVGPHIDTASLKKQLVGKKSGDIKTLISNMPGVKSVNVHFSPFWVSSAPNANKITITIKKG